jgi:hypothetical protein
MHPVRTTPRNHCYSFLNVALNWSIFQTVLKPMLNCKHENVFSSIKVIIVQAFGLVHQTLFNNCNNLGGRWVGIVRLRTQATEFSLITLALFGWP